MLRRCVNSPGYRAGTSPPVTAGRVAIGVRASMLVAMQLLLIGCGSTARLPELEQYPQRSTEQAAAATPTTASTPEVPSNPSAAAPAAPIESSTSPQRSTGRLIEPLTLDNSAIPLAAQQQFADAVAFAERGDLAAAEKAFDNLNALYPNYSGPLVNLAVLRAKAGNLEGAEQALQAAVERNPDSALAFNQLGILYRRLGRFKEADTAYLRAVQIDPAYANAYFNLGVLCDLYLQQPQRALEAFERYLELASQPDAKVKGWVSELKSRLGNARSARSEQ